MKLNVTQQLINIRGQVIRTSEAPDAPATLLRDILIEALLGRATDDRPPPAAEQLKLYTLAQRVQENDEVDVDAETLVLLRNKVAAVYFPAIGGPALKLLEV